MKFKALPLALWFLLSYFLYGPLRDLAADESFVEVFDFLFNFQDFVTIFTSLMAFFAYALATYAILFYGYRKIHLVWLVLLLILMIPSVAYFRYFLQEIVQQALFGFGNYTAGYDLYFYFLDNLYYGLFFPWVGGIFYFVQYSSGSPHKNNYL